MSTEADTCRKLVVPKLVEAGWDSEPHSFTEQRTFTDGRIIVTGAKVRRGPQKRADYLLRYAPDFMIAVVEAKPDYQGPGDGLQQAKDYAETLDLKFAYSTNGTEIVEFDYLSGLERCLNAFPSPGDLWLRLHGGEAPGDTRELTPTHRLASQPLRYYQEIAVNRTVQAILGGKKRVLLTMATGTGKTLVAFQICWKLWSSYWNRAGEHRRPRILYLADRNILVDDPKEKYFAPFGAACKKIQNGTALKSRDIYFATYQAIAEDERRPGLFKEYKPGFFDLIIVDECHRGSARDESNWREILDYFRFAYKLGMTATPKSDDNIDTYGYFHNPVYTYSLRQGIEDGFLAPYRVHRVVTNWDAVGWRPGHNDLDRFGRPIPDGEYKTGDFERVVALRARTLTIAAHLTGFLKQTDRFAKTIVFCVDQEHADEMRRQLSNLNSDLVQQHPDYVVRVTADEGKIGMGHLSRFQDPERLTPVIVTTSQLLSTGVDVPTCKNIVLARLIGSMVEFKQIIGRGARVRDDFGKYFFTILDYTGSATSHFADPVFDGEPDLITVEEMNDAADAAVDTSLGAVTGRAIGEAMDSAGVEYNAALMFGKETGSPPRKFYFDGGQVVIVHQSVHELDADGHQLRVVEYADYTAEKVRSLFVSGAELRKQWSDPQQRAQILAMLEARGINFNDLAAATQHPEADPFDLLCNVAFGAPLRTRRERADWLLRENRAFLQQYRPEAAKVLTDLLAMYTEHGTSQFTIPDALNLPPISERGNVMEIAKTFGGAEKLRLAVLGLQRMLYQT
jgi:type I restriction enzyme R subunit